MHPGESTTRPKSAIALPENSLLLGMGMDGLPLVLDLSDWGPGSFLVAAEDDRFIQPVFQMVIGMAGTNSSPYGLCLHLAASGFEAHSDRLRTTLRLGDPARVDVVEEIYSILKQREAGRLRLPYHVLLIENWVAFTRELPPKTLGHLLTLVAHGPFWGIWVLAGMRPGQLHEGLYEQVERFPSRILGRITDAALARYFSGLPLVNLKGLKPDQAVVRVGEDVFSVFVLEREPGELLSG